MGSLWIEADSVGVEALPDWARSAAPAKRGVVLARDGLVVRDRRGRVSAATWGRVFGVVMRGPGLGRERSLLVLVPREPPAPPWLELSHYDLTPPIVGLDALSSAIAHRLEQGGAYRGREPGAPRLGAAELLERARAREAIPGAVQVPVAIQHTGFLDGRVGQTVVLGSGGGAIGAYLAAALAGATLASPVVWGVAAAGAAVAGALSELVSWQERRHRALEPRRVLLLAPDGCVCGFAEGVQAFAWADVGEFRNEGALHLQVLAVRDRDGALRGTIAAHWFGEPLELIVAVAEAYRKRAAG